MANGSEIDAKGRRPVRVRTERVEVPFFSAHTAGKERRHFDTLRKNG
jgi:hypothetical protein